MARKRINGRTSLTEIARLRDLLRSGHEIDEKTGAVVPAMPWERVECPPQPKHPSEHRTDSYEEDEAFFALTWLLGIGSALLAWPTGVWSWFFHLDPTVIGITLGTAIIWAPLLFMTLGLATLASAQFAGRHITYARGKKQLARAPRDPLYTAFATRPWATEHGTMHVAYADQEPETGAPRVRVLRGNAVAKKHGEWPYLSAQQVEVYPLADDASAQDIADAVARAEARAESLEVADDQRVRDERLAALDAKRRAEIEAADAEQLAAERAQTQAATVEIARHALRLPADVKAKKR